MINEISKEKKKELKDKRKAAIKKEKTNKKPPVFWIATTVEVICFISALILWNHSQHSHSFAEFLSAIIVFGVGILILIADTFYSRKIRFYSFDIVGKELVYRKLKTSEYDTYDKDKKYYIYSVKKKDIKSVKTFGLFKVIYGTITQKTMNGRNVVFSKSVDKLIVPYYIDKKTILKFGLKD